MSTTEATDTFVRLLSQHEVAVRNYILLLVPDWNDAQDLMQQTSLILWRKFDQFEPGSNFRAWAFQIAKLEAKDHWKRKMRHRRLFSDEFLDSVAREAESMADELEHRRAVLRHCIDRMPVKQRELLAGRYLQAMSIEQLALSVRKSVDAVYKSLNRMRQALIDCVSQATTAERQ